MKPTHNTCTECGITKPIDLFHINKDMAIGHANKCKMCVAQCHRNRRIAKARVDPINGLLRKWGRV